MWQCFTLVALGKKKKNSKMHLHWTNLLQFLTHSFIYNILNPCRLPLFIVALAPFEAYFLIYCWLISVSYTRTRTLTVAVARYFSRRVSNDRTRNLSWRQVKNKMILNARKCVKKHKSCLDPQITNYGSIDFTLTYTKCRIE